MLFEPSIKKQDSGLSLIPLINIVFLLLLFFLVSGSWRDSVERDVSLPASDQPLESVHDGVAVALTSDGTWRMAGQAVTLPQLTQQLQGAARINIYADEAAAASSLLALLVAMEASPSQLFLIVRRNP